MLLYLPRCQQGLCCQVRIRSTEVSPASGIKGNYTIHTCANVILAKQMLEFSLCCVYVKRSRGQARLHLGSSLQHLPGTSGTRRRSELCGLQPGRPGAAAVCQRRLHHQGVALAADGAPVAGHGPPVQAPQSPFVLAVPQQELCERKAVIEVRSEFVSPWAPPRYWFLLGFTASCHESDEPHRDRNDHRLLSYGPK